MLSPLVMVTTTMMAPMALPTTLTTGGRRSTLKRASGSSHSKCACALTLLLLWLLELSGELSHSRYRHHRLLVLAQTLLQQRL